MNEHTAASPGPPDLDTLRAFLQEKADTLGDDVRAHHVEHFKPVKRAIILSARGVKSDICPLCSATHNLRQCPDFAAQRPLQQQETARGLHLCFNCLGKGHTLTNSPSQYRCRECSSRHHTLLHRSRTTAPDTPSETTPTPQTHTSARASKSRDTNSCVLPTTAVVRVQADGRTQGARAMLDSGSTLTMVASRLVNSLNLKKFRKSIINVKGFEGLTPSTREVELVLCSSQP